MLKSRVAQFAGRPDLTLAGLGTLFCVLLVGLFLLDLQARYRWAIDEAHRATRSYAVLLAEHTARSVESIDRTLHAVAELHSDTAGGTVDGDAAYQSLRQLGRSPLTRRSGAAPASSQVRP